MSSDDSTIHAVVAEVPASLPVQRLSRYAAVFGIILGGVGSIEGLAWLTTVILRFTAGGPGGQWPAISMRYSAALVSTAASPILIAGSIGWLRRKPWGRVVMLAYAWLALVGYLLMVISRAWDITFGSFPFGWLLTIVILLDDLGTALSGIVFPLCVMVLIKLEARRGSYGFQPIMTVSQ